MSSRSSTTDIEVDAGHRGGIRHEWQARAKRERAHVTGSIGRPAPTPISTIHDAKHLLPTPITHQHSPIGGFVILRPMFLICSPGTSPARFVFAHERSRHVTVIVKTRDMHTLDSFSTRKRKTEPHHEHLDRLPL
ncbi:hypothetical protein [Burkholderia cepacia]|uniref:Uncharacterized protein n=1 Tax=Burkholderia cepacia TaxID=292 RepID=A0A8I1B0M4_BURCE|nr:hypothetical protein [Burkholderia cepacia]MBH9685759.1 hypothetical protein [Burkholderia cepacia]MBH9700356.1 hypothetical protein [Burkholderia cepacia]MBH9714149.1 hypothetical protein [Burkholderia cepacia]MBH9734493.1 hypothetical protein [Burkholderia cepacia]MBX3762204.1 hypothetical protein [Burkholderia cepacia]